MLNWEDDSDLMKLVEEPAASTGLQECCSSSFCDRGTAHLQSLALPAKAVTTTITWPNPSHISNHLRPSEHANDGHQQDRAGHLGARWLLPIQSNCAKRRLPEQQIWRMKMLGIPHLQQSLTTMHLVVKFDKLIFDNSLSPFFPHLHFQAEHC